MDLVQAFGTDIALLLFSAAGLVVTTLAIIHDTRTQVAVAKESVRLK